MKRNWWQILILWFAGYCLYIAIEVTFRGESYVLMGVAGGLSVLLIGYINDNVSWGVPLILQMGWGGLIITTIEYGVGLLDRFYLHLHMWDYSNVPLHDPYGVVCVPFTLLWCLLSFVAIILDDAIAYYAYHGKIQPYYRSLSGKILFMLPKRECD